MRSNEPPISPLQQSGHDATALALALQVIDFRFLHFFWSAATCRRFGISPACSPFLELHIGGGGDENKVLRTKCQSGDESPHLKK